MKNKEILANLEALSKVGANDKALPVKVAYAISKNLKSLSKEAKDIDEMRVTIAKDYCEVDESEKLKVEDGKFTIKDGCEKEFEEKVNELFELESELELRKICIDDLNHVELSVNDMLALDFMINE